MAAASPEFPNTRSKASAGIQPAGTSAHRGGTALKRDDARRLLARNVDPGAERRAARVVYQSTFEAVARDYLGRLSRHVRDSKRSTETLKKATWILERFCFRT